MADKGAKSEFWLQNDGADVIGRPMDEGLPQDPWLQTSQATTVWPAPIEHDAIHGDHIAHVGAASLEHQAHYEPNPTVLGSAQQQSPPSIKLPYRTRAVLRLWILAKCVNVSVAYANIHHHFGSPASEQSCNARSRAAVGVFHSPIGFSTGT